MTVSYLWSGAVTETTATVNAGTTAASARLAVSTDPALTSPVFSAAQAPASGAVMLPISGLSANTVYFYAVEEDGVLNTSITGQFKTDGATTQTWVISACSGSSGCNFPWPDAATSLKVSNSPIFTTIGNLSPDLFLHTGDLHYKNLAVADLAQHAAAYDDVMSAPLQAALYRKVAVARVWDDHDGWGDNSDSTGIGRTEAGQAYRLREPSFPLPDSGACYHSFTRMGGKVLVVMLDTRFYRDPNVTPDSPTKTMLGPAQKAWLTNLLATSTAKFMVMVSSVEWMGTSADTWGGFTFERDEIVGLLEQYGWLDRMVMINGNYHGLCMDTGSGNDGVQHGGGGFPVYVWASLDSNTGDGSPLTYYDLGPTSTGQDRYGTLDIVDQGDWIKVTGTGYIGTTVYASHTFFVATTPAAPQLPAELSVAHLTDLERIRATITDPASYDPFNETFPTSISSGWGTAQTGQVWSTSGGAAGEIHTTDVGGGVIRGRMDCPADGVRRFATAGSYADVDYTATVTLYEAVTGASVEAGLLARYGGASSDFYLAMLLYQTDGTVQLRIDKRVGGTFTNLGLAGGVVTHAPFTPTHIRFQVQGTQLQARAWLDGTSEPSTWQVVAADTALTSGAIGAHSVTLAGNTNTSPVHVDYDDFATIDPLPLIVNLDRSDNGAAYVPVRGGQTLLLPAGGQVTVDDYEWPSGVPVTYRATTVGNPSGLTIGQATASITATLTGPWLKSIPFPALNVAVDPSQATDVSRRARVGIYPVMGSRLPVAVTDVRQGAEFQLEIATVTDAESAILRRLLAGGSPVYLHVPSASYPVPGGHYAVGDVVEQRKDMPWQRRWFALPLTEVAPPGADVIPTTITWQGVEQRWATWQDLVAEEPTWQDLANEVQP